MKRSRSSSPNSSVKRRRDEVESNHNVEDKSPKVSSLRKVNTTKDNNQLQQENAALRQQLQLQMLMQMQQGLPPHPTNTHVTAAASNANTTSSSSTATRRLPSIPPGVMLPGMMLPGMMPPNMMPPNMMPPNMMFPSGFPMPMPPLPVPQSSSTSSNKSTQPTNIPQIPPLLLHQQMVQLQQMQQMQALEQFRQFQQFQRMIQQQKRQHSLQPKPQLIKSQSILPKAIQPQPIKPIQTKTKSKSSSSSSSVNDIERLLKVAAAARSYKVKAPPIVLAARSPRSTDKDGIHPLLIAEQEKKKNRLREKGSRASAVFRKKRNTKTEALEKHQTALRRATELLKKHRIEKGWGMFMPEGDGDEDDADSSSVNLVSSSSSSSSVSSTSTSTSSSSSSSSTEQMKVSPSSPRSVKRDDYAFLQRALYSLDLADLTVQTNLSHIGGTTCTNISYQHALDTLTSTVRVLDWTKEINQSRGKRVAEWTNIFNATGRTLHVVTNGQLMRQTALLKAVEHSLLGNKNNSKSNTSNTSSTNSTNSDNSGSSSSSGSNGSGQSNTATEIDWLVDELEDVLKLSPRQKNEIMKMKEQTCCAELSIGLMGKSFKAIREASSQVSNLHHQVHTALTSLLQDEQLELFLKKVNKVREQVRRNGATTETTTTTTTTSTSTTTSLPSTKSTTFGTSNIFEMSVNPLGNDSVGYKKDNETLTDYLRRLLSATNVTTDSNSLNASYKKNNADHAGHAGRDRQKAERVLANARVVGMDSESAMSATEEYVQRRDGVLNVLQEVYRDEMTGIM